MPHSWVVLLVLGIWVGPSVVAQVPSSKNHVELLANTNTSAELGNGSSIGGGWGNVASGTLATVAGGSENKASVNVGRKSRPCSESFGPTKLE